MYAFSPPNMLTEPEEYLASGRNNYDIAATRMAKAKY